MLRAASRSLFMVRPQRGLDQSLEVSYKLPRLRDRRVLTYIPPCARTSASSGRNESSSWTSDPACADKTITIGLHCCRGARRSTFSASIRNAAGTVSSVLCASTGRQWIGGRRCGGAGASVCVGFDERETPRTKAFLFSVGMCVDVCCGRLSFGDASYTEIEHKF